MSSSSSNPPTNLPPSMGPGARPLEQGESPGSPGLIQEISEIRSHYNVHLGTDAIELGYDLKGQARHYRLPFDNIPITGWTKTLCWGGQNGALVSGTLLIDMIRASENMSGRRITQEEAEGIACYSSRRMLTMYFGQMAGVGIGVGAAWMGRKDMKFPFIKPKDPERYQSFPMRVLPLLKGQYARTMWQITRGNMYIFMWLFFTNPLFRSVADTRMTVGLYQDPRTQELTKALKGKFDRLRSNRASEAAPGIQPTPQPQRDDASPSAFDDSQSYGNQNDYAGDSSFTDGNTDTGLISDSTMQNRQPQQASPNSWSKAQSRGSRGDYSQPGSSASSSSDFFFDDASPTAGNDPNMAASQPYKKQPQRGAWDRLRRADDSQLSYSTDNGSGRSAPSPDFETKSDSFSFSDRDADRTLAKEQAQKEFDAMLDQERKGSGSSEYDRGMRAAAAGEESNSNSENAWAKRRRG